MNTEENSKRLTEKDLESYLNPITWKALKGLPLKIYPHRVGEDHPQRPYIIPSGYWINQVSNLEPQRLQRATLRNDVATSYKIIGLLSEKTSFGFSYLAEEYVTTVTRGTSHTTISKGLVFFKTPKLMPEMSDIEIHRICTEIFLSFSTEYQHKDRLNEINQEHHLHKGRVGTSKDFGFFRIANPGVARNVFNIPFLVQEFVNEDSLETYVAQKFPTGMDVEDFFLLAERIVTLIKRIHNRQIIHTEIMPKNFLISTKNGDPIPHLVDFGRSFTFGTSVLGNRANNDSSPETAYLAPECSWSVSTDIYGLGGVLFFLATGEPPPNSRQFTERFAAGYLPDGSRFGLNKTEMWKSFIHRRFLKGKYLPLKNESVVKVIDKCLRLDGSQRFSSADRVMQTLKSVRKETPQLPTVIDELKSAVKDLETVKRKGDSNRALQNPTFVSILNDVTYKLRNTIASIKRQHYEIVGEREDLIDALLMYMGSVGVGDYYITVTTPRYWSPRNLGPNGRFLTLNKDLVRSGVHMRRLFLLPETRTSTSESGPDDQLNVLCSHLEFHEEVKKLESEIRQIVKLPEAVSQDEYERYVSCVPVFDPIAETNRINDKIPDHVCKEVARISTQIGRPLGSLFVGFLYEDPSILSGPKDEENVAIYYSPTKKEGVSISFVSLDASGDKHEYQDQIVKVRFKRFTDNKLAVYQTLQMLARFKTPIPLEQLDAGASGKLAVYNAERRSKFEEIVDKLSK